VRPSFAAVVSVLLLTGCDPFFVELEIPELCQTQTDVTFDGLGFSAGTQTFVQTLHYDLASSIGILESAGLDADLRLLNVTFTAKSGVQDFSFVYEAEIAAQPPSGSALQSARVLAYQKPNGHVPAQVTLSGETVDLVEYLSAGAVDLNATITGDLPQNNWSFDVKACIYVRGKFSYLQAR
jgi:hypothetical protein